MAYGVETWYQYMKDTPNANNPAAAPLLITNSNGAVLQQFRGTYLLCAGVGDVRVCQLPDRREELHFRQERILRRHPGAAYRVQNEIQRAYDFLESLDRIDHRVPPGTPL